MAEAPAAQGPQVMPGQLPQVAANVQMPLAAAGGGPVREQQTQIDDETQMHIGRAVQLEKLKADQISATQRAAAMQQAATYALKGNPNDPSQPGYLSLQGENAKDALVPTLEGFKKTARDIIDSSPNEDVKRLVSQKMEGIHDELMSNAQGHFMNQQQVMAKQALNGLIQVHSDAGAAAYGTPDWQNQVERHKDEIMRAIRTDGVTQKGDFMVDKNGRVIEDEDGHPMAGPETQAEMDKAGARYDQGILKSMLAAGNPVQARKYLESSSDLKGDSQVYENLKKAVDTDYVTYKAVIKTRDIIQDTAKPDATLAQNKDAALQKTETMTSGEGPEVDKQFQAETRRHINQYYDDQKQKLAQQQEQQGASVYDFIAKNHRLPDASVTQGMNTDHLREYLEGPRKVSDKATLYALKDMAAGQDNAEKQDFADENLWDYRHKLNDADFKSLQAQQSKARGGVNAPSPDMTAWRMQTEVGNEAMISLGMDPNMPKNKAAGWFQEPEKTVVQRFREDMDAGIDQWKATNPGKTLTRDDVSGVAQRLVLAHVGAQQEAGSVFKTAPYLNDLTDAPKEAMDAVDQYLKQGGIKQPTEAQRLSYYQYMVTHAQ